MRFIALTILLASLALASQIGLLNFLDVNSEADFKNALSGGPLLIFISQPGCTGCEYLKENVFTQQQVAEALRGVKLISIDLAKYFVKQIPAVINGSIYVYTDGRLSVMKKTGETSIPIYGTPTVIMGYAENGVLHVTFIMIGPTDPPQFVEFVKMAFVQPAQTPQGNMANTQALSTSGSLVTLALLAQLGASFLAGAVSVFSPCVLPVITVASTGLLARRNVGLILIGMMFSYAVLGTVATAVAGLTGNTALYPLYAIGGIVLIAMGLTLLVEDLNKRFTTWASRFQTAAFKTSRRATGAIGDLALGASLGAVWAPCIAPIFGTVVVTNIIASAISGNYLTAFLATLAYAGGLALVVYLILSAAKKGLGKKAMKWNKWGRRLEIAVGIISILLGVLFLGEAFGIHTLWWLYSI